MTSPEILSIETVLSQPSDWKALVLTELFFNIPGMFHIEYNKIINIYMNKQIWYNRFQPQWINYFS